MVFINHITHGHSFSSFFNLQLDSNAVRNMGIIESGTNPRGVGCIVLTFQPRTNFREYLFVQFCFLWKMLKNPLHRIRALLPQCRTPFIPPFRMLADFHHTFHPHMKLFLKALHISFMIL